MKWAPYFRCAFVLPVLFASVFSIVVKAEGLTSKDRALLGEVYYLHSKLAKNVWHNWSLNTSPILYVKESFQFLINHPSPPIGYIFVEKWDGRAVYVNQRDVEHTTRAAYPLNGVVTAVVGELYKEERPEEWVLTALHELFHVYQSESLECKLKSPFIGTEYNEISYPFDYMKPEVLSLMRLEAENVFLNMGYFSDEESSQEIKNMNLSEHFMPLYKAIFSVNDLKYKHWIEWKEGTARYTERELALLASDRKKYSASSDFIKHYHEANYNQLLIASADYLNPVRFIGKGVIGRVSLYYMGLGKSYLLDKHHPSWKDEYCNKNLDDY